MEPEVGLARDIEVVRAIRAHVDPDVKLMVDSNNGYDLDTTKRFLEEADVEFFFVEEMFPESVEEDLELKRWIQARGWETLVADGESARDIEHFTPYIARAAFDVLQGDIRRTTGCTSRGWAGPTQLGVIPRPLHASGAWAWHSELCDG